ncbi:MAG: sensor histidine kinase [Variibacter sp.]
MHRLYLQFYLTIIAILVLIVVTMAALWHLGFDERRFDEAFSVAGELATNALPAPEAPKAQQQQALDRLHERLRSDLSLYTTNGKLIAQAGRPMPPHVRLDREPGWMRGPGGPAWLLKLNDGRTLVVSLPHGGPWRPGAWLLSALAAIAFAVALGAYPIARRLTRRLERLKGSVDKFGSGDLGARAPVQGKDEVAALATSFNQSAARIEELVRAHKLLLANCSHELRTPLTRINMALALLAEDSDPKLRGHLKADIGELDQLIEEILLASRLEAVGAPERAEDFDLVALAAEEAAREGVAVEGESVTVRGDRVLLRRLVRNLVENAQRHAGDESPEMTIRRDGVQAVLTVRDHGAGVPAEERERIFEPFYRPAGFAESGRGTGLGLALVRQIARGHGGDVTCEAADGGGSRFVVRLPVANGVHAAH